MVRVCLLSMYDSSAHCLQSKHMRWLGSTGVNGGIKFGKVTQLSPASNVPHIETNCESLSLRENYPSQTLGYERVL